MTLTLLFLAACSFRVHCSTSEVHGRQTYGNGGWLPSLASPAAQPPTFINELPGDRPNPQNSYYVPEVPHSFPKRPIPDILPDSQFLGQLGQYIQQGITNHYIGNSPTGQQTFNQFAGVQGQYSEGQFYTPSAPLVTPVSGALASIAMYDDLRCVPRLLCETAAGGKPGYSGSKQQDSPVPFVNRDTLLSLLTTFNFADTSPLMVFGRAILLGVTAKGDPSTCFSAYPNCPRDPDRLVDYLNNHNGGFFRFFGTQRPYHPPHYLSRIQTGVPHFTTTSRPQDFQGNYPYRFQHQIATSLKPPLPPHQYTDLLRHEVSTSRQTLVFPSNGNNRQSKGSKFFHPNVTENSGVKTFSFPTTGDSKPSLHTERLPLEQMKHTAPMTFPDKTGTGEFILDIKDVNGPLLNVSPFPEFESQYETSDPTSNRKDRLKFPQNRDKTGTMKFPKIFYENSVDNNRNQKQATSLKFPSREDRTSDYRSQI